MSNNGSLIQLFLAEVLLQVFGYQHEVGQGGYLGEIHRLRVPHPVPHLPCDSISYARIGMSGCDDTFGLQETKCSRPVKQYDGESKIIATVLYNLIIRSFKKKFNHFLIPSERSLYIPCNCSFLNKRVYRIF